jgi:DNA modification methylase
MTSLRDRLLVGDARSRLTEAPDETIQLTVTSPPYNQGMDYEDGDDDR